jgi:hypothetical protein
MEAWAVAQREWDAEWEALHGPQSYRDKYLLEGVDDETFADLEESRLEEAAMNPEDAATGYYKPLSAVAAARIRASPRDALEGRRKPYNLDF